MSPFVWVIPFSCLLFPCAIAILLWNFSKEVCSYVCFRCVLAGRGINVAVADFFLFHFTFFRNVRVYLGVFRVFLKPRFWTVHMSHTVITNSSTNTRTSGDGVLNMGYTRTIPGLLKMGQLVRILVEPRLRPTFKSDWTLINKRVCSHRVSRSR